MAFSFIHFQNTNEHKEWEISVPSLKIQLTKKLILLNVKKDIVNTSGFIQFFRKDMITLYGKQI